MALRLEIEISIYSLRTRGILGGTSGAKCRLCARGGQAAVKVGTRWTNSGVFVVAFRVKNPPRKLKVSFRGDNVSSH